MAASKPSRSEPSWITSWPMLVFLTAYSSCARNLRLRDSGLFYSSLLRRIRLQIFYRNRDGTLFDDAIAACTSVAEDHAKTQRETKSTLSSHLAQSVPDLEHFLEYPAILDALWIFTEGLAELIRQRQNSIWSFIVRNSYRPAMFRQQFD